MRRILAHNVIFEGEKYRLSVVEMADDMTWIRIYPFTQEIANTEFVNGTVLITNHDGVYSFEILDNNTL